MTDTPKCVQCDRAFGYGPNDTLPGVRCLRCEEGYGPVVAPAPSEAPEPQMPTIEESVALEEMAQECERLVRGGHGDNDMRTVTVEALLRWARDCRAAYDRFHGAAPSEAHLERARDFVAVADLNDLDDMAESLAAEFDAIRAETLERAAQECERERPGWDEWGDEYRYQREVAAEQCADDIRALKGETDAE